MNLVTKFNESFKEDNLAFDLYVAFSYGSNPFCFDQAAKLKTSANDSAPSLQQKILGL